MSRRSKNTIDESMLQELHEEEWRELNQYRATLLLKKGVLGFLIGFGLYITYALSDGDDIVWLHACTIGLLCMGIPFGWQCVGGFLDKLYLVFNFPVMVIAFIFRAAAAIIVGFIAYPIFLLLALIRAQKKGSKWKLFFCVLLYIFIWLVALFIIGTSL